MKNLYLILRKNSKLTAFNLIKKSAEERNINVKPIYTEDFDSSEQDFLTENDGLYRIASDTKSSALEKILINENVITFFKSYLYCMGNLKKSTGSFLTHFKNNLPIIPTIAYTSQKRVLISKYVEMLGGFPIILKVIGGSHGVGVMKIDSLESLYSVIDYLDENNIFFILRKFIDYKAHARMIVLGDKVVSSIEYKRVKDDFRSNVGHDLTIVNTKFDKKVEETAVKSVSVLGYEFGGVDILIDRDDQIFIAEVNLPCYFPRAQQYSNIDISGQMIDFLINKSKSKISEK